MDLFGENSGKSFKDIPLAAVAAEAMNCQKCPLSKGRTNVVFGSGPVPCDIMLIGEAPGEQEDLQGLPFVGKAGQLLTKIIETAEINRDTDIYIANTVKCRPPENRTPTTEEIRSCYPYLEAQIHHVKPKIILLAGAPAVKTILGNDEGMTKIRGKWFKYKGIDVMPIFHPSYLLRNQSRAVGSPKWYTWQDMIEIKGAREFIRKVAELK
ncbi:MAG: uracil-DNA glycosylase [bacterium]